MAGANSLKLEVLLGAVDKITAPLRSITRSTTTTARALKAGRDQLRELQAQQRDVSSFRALKTATQQTKRELAEKQKKLRDLSNAMRAAGAPSAALSAQMKRAQKEAKALKERLAQEQRQLQGLRGELSDAGISTQNLGDHERQLRDRIGETNRVIAEQEDRLRLAAVQQQRLTRANEQYQAAQGLAGSMSATGAAGVATGSAVLYAGAQMMAPQIAAEHEGARIAAQMGETSARAKEYAAIIRGIRADGEEAEAIAAAVAAATSTLGALGKTSNEELDSAARSAIALGAVMGGDIPEYMQSVGVLMKNGLAKSSAEAFDLLTAGLQNVSTTMRDELPEILHEYSTHFRGMGFSGKQAMNLLVEMAQQGKFALDKTGDAIKEFTLRGSDMSKASVDAYEKIGLNAEQMSNAIASGGNKAQSALQQTAKGLLAIEDPAERANTAIALFGTPVEDLSIDQIPAFLAALGGAPDKLGEFAGAAGALGQVLDDNIAGDIKALGGAWSELNSTLMDGHGSGVRDMIQGITGLVRGVREWSAENPALASGAVKAAMGFGMLALAGGALTLMLASLLGPFAIVRYGLAMLGITSLPVLAAVGASIRALGVALWGLAANPVVLIAAAIAGAAYLIWRNWDTLGPKFAAMWTGIKAVFSETLTWFAGLPARFFQFGADILTGLANGITSALGAVKAAVVGAGEATVGWFKDKLGIHSPSRVFAELGGYTMQGLDQGLSAAQGGPLKTVAGIARQLTAAGTVALGAGMAMPAMAGMPPLDSRPPLAAPAPAGGQVIVQGDTITIQLGAGGQGSDLAQQINRILDERERGKAARVRSLLADRD